MTNEEAAKIVKSNYEITESLGVLLEANSYRIPRTVKVNAYCAVCPTCGQIIGINEYDVKKYCEFCGQRLESVK